MAQTEKLPLYDIAYDLCLHIECVVDNFSRSCKYSIGIDLKDTTREVLKLVVRANSRRDKAETLIKLREEINEVKILLSLCLDIMAFPDFSSYEHAIDLVSDIEKQFEGWLNGHSRIEIKVRPKTQIGLTD